MCHFTCLIWHSFLYIIPFVCYLLLAWLTHHPWRWKQCVPPPEHSQPSARLQGTIPQDTEIFNSLLVPTVPEYSQLYVTFNVSQESNSERWSGRC
jgi:hypothetical protein